MSIQILQYDFLGPIKFEEWGPPMEKVVYLILSRTKDLFNLIYVGTCEQTNDSAFFTQNSAFQCWIDQSGSEKQLYIAILPLFDSKSEERNQIQTKIINRYHPICNSKNTTDEKPTGKYSITKKPNVGDLSHKISCPCCGSEMKVEKILENTTIIRCMECGISDSRVNS